MSALVERRDAVDYKADFWENIVRMRSASPLPTRPVPTSPQQQVAHWQPDEASKHCMICDKQFSVLDRRHHCRKCGKLVCNACGPKDNSKPILQMGIMEPVRHCRKCYQSPGIQWNDLD